MRLVPFRMRFVDSSTGAPVTLASTYLSFLDIDQGMDEGVTLRELISVSGFESYVLADDTRLTVARDTQHTSQPAQPTTGPQWRMPTTFISGGGAVMDPTDPMALDGAVRAPRHLARVVAVRAGLVVRFVVAAILLDDNRVAMTNVRLEVLR